MSQTRVISVKSGEPFDVYIGRGGYYGPRYGRLPQSKWHNPRLSLPEYEAYIWSRPDLIAALPELEGKVLAWWCKHPDPATPCHGDVLVKLVGKGEAS